jgi:hypothetical protein
MGMEAIHAVKQLFVKRDSLGKIQVLLAKQVDDNLAAGTPDGTAWFLREIQKHFECGTIVKAPDTIRFDGGTVDTLPNGDVVFSMEQYLKSMDLITLSREIRRLLHAKTTVAETKAFQRRCGQFFWL